MQPDATARLEDLTWLAETGESASGAARRLGTTFDALEKWCRAHGHVDLWHRLNDHEPRDHNAVVRGRSHGLHVRRRRVPA